LVVRFNVESFNILDFTDNVELIESNVGFRPFQLKPLALLYTDLKEVLLLDADSTAVRDPTFLFDDKRYQSTGSVFWPDYWVTPSESPVWELFGQTPSTELEQESGQMLVNKQTAWKAITLVQALQKSFYYSLVNGDKDTFKFAWKFSNTPYEMVSYFPAAIGMSKPSGEFCSHSMGQHDLDGDVLFIHHNQLKTERITGLSAPISFFGEKKSVSLASGVQVRVVPMAAMQVSGREVSCIDVETARFVSPHSVVVSSPEVLMSGLAKWERRFLTAYNTVAVHMPASFSLAARQHRLGLQLMEQRNRRAEGDKECNETATSVCVEEEEQVDVVEEEEVVKKTTVVFVVKTVTEIVTVAVVETKSVEAKVEKVTGEQDVSVDEVETTSVVVSGYVVVEVVVDVVEEEVEIVVGTGVFSLQAVEVKIVVGTKKVTVVKEVITGYTKVIKTTLVTTVTIVPEKKTFNNVAQFEVPLGPKPGLCAAMSPEDKARTLASIKLFLKKSTPLTTEQIGAVKLACTDNSGRRRGRATDELGLSAEVTVTASASTVQGGDSGEQLKGAADAAVGAVVGIKSAVAGNTFDVKTSVGGTVSAVTAGDVKSAVEATAVKLVTKPIEVETIKEEVVQEEVTVEIEVPVTESITVVEEEEIFATVTVSQLVEETTTKTVKIFREVVETQTKLVDLVVEVATVKKGAGTAKVSVVEVQTEQKEVDVAVGTKTEEQTISKVVEEEVELAVAVVTSTEVTLDCTPIVLENAKGIEKYELSFTKGGTFEDCRANCAYWTPVNPAKTPGQSCLFYAYSKEKVRCNLFKKAGSAKETLEQYVDDNDNYASYFHAVDHDKCRLPTTTAPPPTEFPPSTTLEILPNCDIGTTYVRQKKRVGTAAEVIVSIRDLADDVACADNCDAESSCVAFSFKKNSNKCFLFNGATTDKDKESRFKTYIKQDCIAAVCEFSRYEAANNQVGDSKHQLDEFESIASAEACSEKCDQLGTCFVFSFKASNNKCKLFKQKSVTQLKPSDDFTTYVAGKYCPGRAPPTPDEMVRPACAFATGENYARFSSTDGDEKYLVGFSKDVELTPDCLRLCELTPECYFFSYKTDSERCYMYKQKGAVNAGMDGNKLVSDIKFDAFIPSLATDGCEVRGEGQG
jgi:hypothetical protein